MKTIIIYSGKGGVGKSTISAMLAEKLSNDKKVVIIDGDLTAPSLHVYFEVWDPNKNLHVLSIGFQVPDGLIQYQSTTAKTLLRSYSKQIKKLKPDYLIIDTPPGITDIHSAIFDVFDISGVFIISQKTKMSLDKVNRTRAVFGMYKIPVIGVILNMVGAFEEVETADALLEIPMDKALKFDDKIVELVKYVKKLKDSDFKEFLNNKLTFSSMTERDIDMMRHGITLDSKKIHFYNLETWSYVRDLLIEHSFYGVNDDKFLDVNDYNNLSALVNAFKETEKALFMIVRPPLTEIKLFAGEIGYATLVLDRDSYYGVPRIKYYTDQGELILFSHEVKAVSIDELQTNLHEYKELIKHPDVSIERYLPTREVLQIVANTFGETISGSLEVYDRIFAN